MINILIDWLNWPHLMEHFGNLILNGFHLKFPVVFNMLLNQILIFRNHRSKTFLQNGTRTINLSTQFTAIKGLLETFDGLLNSNRILNYTFITFDYTKSILRDHVLCRDFEWFNDNAHKLWHFMNNVFVFAQINVGFVLFTSCSM